MRVRSVLLWCLLILAGSPVRSGAQQAPPPACAAAESRQFDFWLGKWEVYSGDQLAGENTITLEDGGCVLREHWRGRRGGTGQSVNYFDPGEREWFQTWTDGSGTFRRFHGRYEGTVMRLTAESKNAGGKIQRHRMAFFNNADSTVRQLAETSEDGKTWKTVVDLVYRRPVSRQTFGCPGPEYHQFDFWVGDWDVTVAGKPAGHNSITREEQGCLIHEHWNGRGGSTGQSFNFYDASTRQWNQVWVDNQTSSLRLSGTFSDNQMKLTGVAPGPDGKPQQQRLTFFRNDDGTVRQLWETSGDGTSWQVAFDGLYQKRP